VEKLEVDVENRSCAYAKRTGWIPAKLVNLGERGWPDRWFLKPGPRIIIIEFKRPGQKLRPLQKYKCKILRGLGFEVHEGVDNFDDAKRILDATHLPD